MKHGTTSTQRTVRHLKRGAKSLGVTLRSYMRQQAWCSHDAADWLRRKNGNPSTSTVIPRHEMLGITQLVERTKVLAFAESKKRLLEQTEDRAVQEKVDRLSTELQGEQA